MYRPAERSTGNCITVQELTAVTADCSEKCLEYTSESNTLCNCRNTLTDIQELTELSIIF